MVKYLLDTDVVVDHLAGRVTETPPLSSLVGDGIAIGLITYGELYEGVLYSRRSQEAEIALLGFLRWYACSGSTR